MAMGKPVPSNGARVLYGTAYIVLAAVAIPLYSAVIFIFAKKSNFRKQSCYWIMISMGLFDLLFLVGCIPLGSRVLLNDPFPKWAEKITMNLPNAVFNGTIIMIWALALNRLFVIVSSQLFQVPSATYGIIILFSWLYVISLFFISVFEDGMEYKSLYLIAVGFRQFWAPWASKLAYANDYIGFILFGAVLVMYTVVVVYLIVRRFLLKSVHHNYTKELTILSQGIFIFLGGTLITLNATFGDVVFPSVYWYTGSYEIFLIAYTGFFNPLIYLTMNSELRREFRRLILGDKMEIVAIAGAHRRVSPL
uniref:G_PROTEIN_RECEP_F1_2 domain-containing protein n=1 Tax=Steinernema glaseri TaxID=37863 RepID=A0A1I7ZR66_9BILA